MAAPKQKFTKKFMKMFYDEDDEDRPRKKRKLVKDVEDRKNKKQEPRKVEAVAKT